MVAKVWKPVFVGYVVDCFPILFNVFDLTFKNASVEKGIDIKKFKDINFTNEECKIKFYVRSDIILNSDEKANTIEIIFTEKQEIIDGLNSILFKFRDNEHLLACIDMLYIHGSAIFLEDNKVNNVNVSKTDFTALNAKYGLLKKNGLIDGGDSLNFIIRY